MEKPHSLFEVTFICQDESDEASFEKWLAEFADGMTILYAGFTEPDHHDMETMIEAGLLEDENGEVSR